MGKIHVYTNQLVKKQNNNFLKIKCVLKINFKNVKVNTFFISVAKLTINVILLFIILYNTQRGKKENNVYL